jgi:hypothetical protein
LIYIKWGVQVRAGSVRALSEGSGGRLREERGEVGQFTHPDVWRIIYLTFEYSF